MQMVSNVEERTLMSMIISMTTILCQIGGKLRQSATRMEISSLIFQRYKVHSCFGLGLELFGGPSQQYSFSFNTEATQLILLEIFTLGVK